jgi:hypothetical protein
MLKAVKKLSTIRKNTATAVGIGNRQLAGHSVAGNRLGQDILSSPEH